MSTRHLLHLLIAKPCVHDPSYRHGDVTRSSRAVADFAECIELSYVCFCEGFKRPSQVLEPLVDFAVVPIFDVAFLHPPLSFSSVLGRIHCYLVSSVHTL